MFAQKNCLFSSHFIALFLTTPPRIPPLAFPIYVFFTRKFLNICIYIRALQRSLPSLAIPHIWVILFLLHTIFLVYKWFVFSSVLLRLLLTYLSWFRWCRFWAKKRRLFKIYMQQHAPEKHRPKRISTFDSISRR